MAKPKQLSQPFNVKKEAKLVPGYLIVTLWILFTAVMLIWILAASFSTSKEIYQGSVFSFASGFHFENYVNAWQTQNVGLFFTNSLIYAITALLGIQLISCPAAYVLSRFKFMGNKVIKSAFIVGMSVPNIIKFRGMAAKPIHFREFSTNSGTRSPSPVHISARLKNTAATGPRMNTFGEKLFLPERRNTPTDQNTKSQPTLCVRTSPSRSGLVWENNIATSAIMKKP